MNREIHDHGQDDPLDFDLTGFEPLAQGIRRAIDAGEHLKNNRPSEELDPEREYS